jgi:hypothetical protein
MNSKQRKDLSNLSCRVKNSSEEARGCWEARQKKGEAAGMKRSEGRSPHG